MPLAVFWSPPAEARAVQFVERLKSENPGVAWRWTQALLARSRALSSYAIRGLGVPELPRRRRIGEVLFTPIRIIYRVDSDRIVILTLRVSRNPPHNHERDRDHHRK
jgi:plasmid stabilization system protein ParE